MKNLFPEILKKHADNGLTPYHRLLVMLESEDAFEGLPQLKYIFDVVGAAGYYRSICGASTADETDALACDFAETTGFRPRYVLYFFRSFAYARGLRDDAPQPPVITRDDTAEEPAAEYGGRASASLTGKKPRWESRWSDDRKRDFLTSLIKVNRDNERRMGVKCSGAICAGFTQYEVRLTVELTRGEDQYATGDLHYAFYGDGGEVLDTGSAGTLCFSDSSPLPCAVTVRVAPHLISSILLFWR